LCFSEQSNKKRQLCSASGTGRVKKYCAGTEAASSNQLQVVEIQISNEDRISNEGHVVKTVFYYKSTENRDFGDSAFL